MRTIVLHSLQWTRILALYLKFFFIVMLHFCFREESSYVYRLMLPLVFIITEQTRGKHLFFLWKKKYNLSRQKIIFSLNKTKKERSILEQCTLRRPCISVNSVHCTSLFILQQIDQRVGKGRTIDATDLRRIYTVTLQEPIWHVYIWPMNVHHRQSWLILACHGLVTVASFLTYSVSRVQTDAMLSLRQGIIDSVHVGEKNVAMILERGRTKGFSPLACSCQKGHDSMF